MSVVLLRNSEKVVTEAEIVEMISNGLNLPEIALKVNIKIRTLEAKMGRIRDTYGAKTMAHLVAVFFRQGLIN